MLSITGWQLGGKEAKDMEDLEVALEDIEEGLEAEMEATSATFPPSTPSGSRPWRE